MKTIYIPQKEKHFTLEDWMIRSVINAKITQWNELQEINEKKSLGAMDVSLGRMNYPSQTDFEAFLNLLSDENLNDIILLAAIGETLDVIVDASSSKGNQVTAFQMEYGTGIGTVDHREMRQRDGVRNNAHWLVAYQCTLSGTLCQPFAKQSAILVN